MDTYELEAFKTLLERLDKSLELQERAIDALREITNDTHLKSALGMVIKNEE